MLYANDKVLPISTGDCLCIKGATKCGLQKSKAWAHISFEKAFLVQPRRVPAGMEFTRLFLRMGADVFENARYKRKNKVYCHTELRDQNARTL